MASSEAIIPSTLPSSSVPLPPPADKAGPVRRTRRVLHIINGEHYSGAERVQDLLALRLPSEGYEVGFAYVKQGRFHHERQAQQVPTYQATMRRPWDLKPARYLADVIRREGYDLIHAHTVRSIIAARYAAKLSGVPFVYHVHSPTLRDSTHWLTNRCKAWAEWVCLRDAARILCVSHSLAAHMATQGCPRHTLQVVANGVPVRGPLPLRDRPEKRWTLGTIALFRPRKGTEVLLDAVAQLRAHGHDVTLRAVGPFESPGYQYLLKDRARELGIESSVEWLGFTNDVEAELDRMDLMVLPSLFGEGLPMVVLEAMAAGVPVVATAVQGVPEVLDDGHGVMTEPGDAPALAAGIASFVEGTVSWHSVRERAWQRQAEAYSDLSMAGSVATAYDQVLGVRPLAAGAAEPPSGESLRLTSGISP